MAKATSGKGQTTKSKTTSRGKSPSGKANTRSAKMTADKPLSKDLKYELVVLIFVALSLLLIISVYFNLGGVVG